MVPLTGCSDLFDYSPHETSPQGLEKGVHERNLGRLLGREPLRKDHFRIGLITDTHYRYHDLHDAVNTLNGQQLDLILVLGDLADQGHKDEYILLQAELERLKAPYLTVIGNHDYLSNGERVYEYLYGPRNYTFAYAGVQVVVWDNVVWESHTEPDWAWLEARLQELEGKGPILLACHIPAWGDQMQEGRGERLANLMTKYGVGYCVSGHTHIYHAEPLPVPQATMPSVDKRQLGVLDIAGAGHTALTLLSY